MLLAAMSFIKVILEFKIIYSLDVTDAVYVTFRHSDIPIEFNQLAQISFLIQSQQRFERILNVLLNNMEA